MAVAAEVKLGRPKGKRTERDDVTVKLDRAVAGMAKSVATSKGVSVAELLTEITRSPIGKLYAQMLRELEGTAKP